MTNKKPTDLQYLQNILIEKEAIVQELRSRVDAVQKILSIEIMRSVQWEQRFDRLLNALQRDNGVSYTYNRQT